MAATVRAHPDPGPGLTFEGVPVVRLQEVVVVTEPRQVGELCRATFRERNQAVVDLEVPRGRTPRHDTAPVVSKRALWSFVGTDRPRLQMA